MKRARAEFALAGVTIIWGTTFVVVKNALDDGIPRVVPQHGRSGGLPQAGGPRRLAVQPIQGPSQCACLPRGAEQTGDAVFNELR